MNATKSTLTKAILVLAIILIFVQSGFAAEVDCGLRGYDGSAIVKFGCDAAASTPLKISKNGTTYNVLLVPTNDPYATKFRIQTQSQGIKALKKYNPIVCGNNTCETGENCSTCVADCGCNTSAGYYCSSGTCINHFGNGVCESSLSETCLNTTDCACTGGMVCSYGACRYVPTWVCGYGGTFPVTQWWMCYASCPASSWFSMQGQVCQYSYNTEHGYTFYPGSCQTCEYWGYTYEQVCGFDPWTFQYTCTWQPVQNNSKYDCICPG